MTTNFTTVIQYTLQVGVTLTATAGGSSCQTGVYTDSICLLAVAHIHTCMRTHVYTYVYTISILAIACLEEVHND